jgi:hypothetical protein
MSQRFPPAANVNVGQSGPPRPQIAPFPPQMRPNAGQHYQFPPRNFTPPPSVAGPPRPQTFNDIQCHRHQEKDPSDQ